jgi:cytochrome P450
LNYPTHSLWSLRRGRSDPLGFLTALAERGDFVPFTLAGHGSFLLNRPDYIEDVLVSSASKFTKGSANQRAKHLLGSGLLTAEGSHHAARRRLIQPAFARQRFDAYASTMVARACRLRDEWQEGHVIDLAGTMSRLTFGIVGETVVGGDVDPFYEDVRLALSQATASVDTLVSLLAPLRRVRPVQARLHRLVERLLAHASPDSGSLLDLLAGGDGDDEQVRDDVLTILLAGHDTIANALTWTWLLLAGHSDVETKLRDEVSAVLGDRLAVPADLPRLGFTRSVLSESLRLYPPAWVIARRAAEEHRVEGGVIPKGSLVLVSQYLMHRDRRYFDEPLSFVPERWLPDAAARRPKMSFFPFGAGPRSCIGESFGWMEGVLLLATVAQGWRLRLMDGEAVQIDPRITLRPRREVLMRIESWN